MCILSFGIDETPPYLGSIWIDSVKGFWTSKTLEPKSIRLIKNCTGPWEKVGFPKAENQGLMEGALGFQPLRDANCLLKYNFLFLKLPLSILLFFSYALLYTIDLLCAMAPHEARSGQR